MQKEKTIQCVGFIMDGNRRWAKEKGLATYEGHLHGYYTMKTMIRTIYKIGIPHIVCYAFSTENWNRTAEEVSYLMHLLAQSIRELHEDFAHKKEKINVKVIGDRTKLPENLCKEIENIEKKHHHEPELTVWIAISYGGRQEIVHAVNHAIIEGKNVDEKSFEQLLWTAGMPDPDIIIRTGGEYRLSNFLLWQSSYSELFFSNVYWPDFGESEFQSILEQYEKRKRRIGR